MSKQKQKGTGGEREVCDLLNASGLFDARRQPGSGIQPGFPDDVLETRVFRGTLEVRFRQSMPVTIYHWLGYRLVGRALKRVRPNPSRALVCRRNFAPWLVIMPLETLVEVVRSAKENDSAHVAEGKAAHPA